MKFHSKLEYSYTRHPVRVQAGVPCMKGWDLGAGGGLFSRSNQFMHLNQPCV